MQLTEATVSAPESLPHRDLAVLFMAFSPQGATPVLDFEGEEEALLEALGTATPDQPSDQALHDLPPYFDGETVEVSDQGIGLSDDVEAGRGHDHRAR